MTTSEVPRRAVVAAVAFIVASIGEFILAFSFGFVLILEQMVFIGCVTETGEDPACNSGLGDSAMFASWGVMALILIASIVVGVVRARRGRTYW